MSRLDLASWRGCPSSAAQAVSARVAVVTVSSVQSNCSGFSSEFIEIPSAMVHVSASGRRRGDLEIGRPQRGKVQLGTVTGRNP